MQSVYIKVLTPIRLRLRQTVRLSCFTFNELTGGLRGTDAAH